MGLFYIRASSPPLAAAVNQDDFQPVAGVLCVLVAPDHILVVLCVKEPARQRDAQNA